MRNGAALDRSLTLETFLTDCNNEFVVKVAKAVIENPGRKYNPLVLYGTVGVGKTHLASAIVNALVQDKKLEKLYFSTFEDFVDSFFSALQERSLQKFRSDTGGYNVFVLDDVQGMENKFDTSDEVMNVLTFLLNQRKQIVLTSNKPLRLLKKVRRRNIERLERGIEVEVLFPAKMARMNMVRAMAEKKNIELPLSIVSIIAGNNQTNGYALEGEFCRMVSEMETWEPLTALS